MKDARPLFDFGGELDEPPRVSEHVEANTGCPADSPATPTPCRDSQRRRHPDRHNARLCPPATTTAVPMRTERSLSDRGFDSLSLRSSAGAAGSASVRAFDWPSCQSLIAASNQGSMGSPTSRGIGRCGVGSAAGAPAGTEAGRAAPAGDSEGSTVLNDRRWSASSLVSAATSETCGWSP